ncbi:hypothetical protein DFH05DRAFT_1542079 [Lentinula detonsa]|uniref:Uncharacterized protein n=1 Tax=Lentinula detonsa TaxID=2804962 RepID=A0A9W8TZT7_9AGAR|nr:hypothetical protein DFH05DRAFT_1542079 [Lentinula detonsa]
MPHPDTQKPFERCIKVDNAALNERIRSSNGVIVDAEIKGLLKLAKQDAVGYELEMEHVRMKYEENRHRLRLRRQGLLNHTEKLSALLSPIRRLADDILSLIFVLCCEDNMLTHNWRYAHALTISSVCSRYPALWSNLTIDSQDDNDHIESVLALYLTRSKTYPLVLESYCHSWYQ